MNHKENYVPPKMIGNKLLEVEAAFLTMSEQTVTAEGQERVELDTFNGNYWE